MSVRGRYSYRSSDAGSGSQQETVNDTNAVKENIGSVQPEQTCHYCRATHLWSVLTASADCTWATGIRGLMRGMATLPQGNQELLVVRDKVRRPPGELGVSESIECDKFFPSVLWHCWLGDRKGIWPVKQLVVGLLVVMTWLELCTTYSSSCHHHFHHPLLQ